MKDFTISIIIEQESPGEDAEVFELITEGDYSKNDDVARISYFDGGVDGNYEQSETTFIVEPARVTLTRGTWLGAEMIFDERHKHHFLYPSPFGVFPISVQTEDIYRDINSGGGCLNIKYSLLNTENVIFSRNSFKISITQT